MRTSKIFNSTKQKILIEEAEVAESFFLRAKGLLGRSELKHGKALVIKKCKSIHTFFMKFPIDVVFVHKNGTVLKIMNNIGRGQVTPFLWKSSYAIEFPADFIQEDLLQVGDVLELIEIG